MACRWTKEASEATTSEEDNQIFQGNVNFRVRTIETWHEMLWKFTHLQTLYITSLLV